MTNKTRPAPWTDQENAAVCSMYFDMLHAAINGHKYVKAVMIRHQQNSHAGPIDSGLNTAPLKIRSRASIEMKLMNCSAAHAALVPGVTTMDGYGYRAMPNFQSTLKAAMAAEISARAELRMNEGVTA